MAGFVTTLAALSAVSWIVLLFFRHGFWRADQRLAGEQHGPARWPDVTALVPARNEQEHIEACLTGLGGQDYPGAFQVLVINDSSTDDTASIARRCAARPDLGHPVDVIDAPDLKAGWAGKLWALDHGTRHIAALGARPEFFWLSDADVVHDPAALRRLVAKAEADGLAMVSLMVRLACASFWERLLVPAFVFFFQMLYPFPAINDPSSPAAGAAGGCILLRRSVLERAGGISAIKDQLIDDCALAARIKNTGAAIWVGLATESHSLRRYDRLPEFWWMVVRSAFVQLGYSSLLLVVSVLGMIITFICAPLIIVSFPLHNSAEAALLGVISWTLMCISYIPTVRYHMLETPRCMTLPAASALYMIMTVHSAVRHWRGLGQNWKNRAYRPK